MSGIRMPWSLTSFIGILMISIVFLFVGLVLIGNFPPDLPPLFSQATVTAEPSTTPTTQHAATITGSVWHDLCASGIEGQRPPTTAPDGCIPLAPKSGYEANGVFDLDEPGIAGIQMRLGFGVCPAIGLAKTVTGEDGTYLFNGLQEGNYCVSIDTMEPQNKLSLMPGHWTYPQRNQVTAFITVTIRVGEERGGVNFGWDYQFLP